jgi:hypothetical protein
VARALPGATADGGDRFPFVVAIKAEGQLICSGTVLYPRIVVTAAHCLQQVVHWRGTRLYVNAYVQPDALSVSVVQRGTPKSYAVVETAISPGWLVAEADQRSGARLPYDLALLVTAAPIDVGMPPSAPGFPTPGSPAGPANHRGMLVAFGGEHCSSSVECEDAGVRRFLPVAMKDGSSCFRTARERAAGLPRAMWCIDANVMPGDSGGALLIEDTDGALHYAGVISAQRGLPPELSAVASWRQSAATALAPNLDFILETARALGYAPAEESDAPSSPGP